MHPGCRQESLRRDLQIRSHLGGQGQTNAHGAIAPGAWSGHHALGHLTLHHDQPAIQLLACLDQLEDDLEAMWYGKLPTTTGLRPRR